MRRSMSGRHVDGDPIGRAVGGSYNFQAPLQLVISIVTRAWAMLVTEDIEAVLRKIEYWHQGSISSFKIMCQTVH